MDNSISDPEIFVKTNIMGTFTLLDSARQYWLEELGGRRKTLGVGCKTEDGATTSHISHFTFHTSYLTKICELPSASIIFQPMKCMVHLQKMILYSARPRLMHQTHLILHPKQALIIWCVHTFILTICQ